MEDPTIEGERQAGCRTCKGKSTGTVRDDSMAGTVC